MATNLFSLSGRTWKQLLARTWTGAAFGAGLAVARLIPNGNGSSHKGWVDNLSEGRAMRQSVVTNQLLEAWEDIEGALVGVAVARFAELLSEAIPGFDREYRKSEAKHSAT